MKIMTECVDVLIVGAGPTGMMMAAECKRHGLTVRLVEKGSSYGDVSRAVAIQARTLEFLHHAGIVAPFLEQGLKIQAARPFVEETQLPPIPFEKLPSRYPFVLSLQQSKTEKILKDHLSALGVVIEQGIEFLSFQERNQEVEISLFETSSGKELKAIAKYLVSCEGAHSKIRRQLGLAFEGRAFQEVFSLADLEISWAYPHNEVRIFLEKEGFLAVIPLPEENLYRVIFQGEPGQDPSHEEVAEKLKSCVRVSTEIGQIFWKANFHINSRMIHSYRRGSIFLAGDAAHIHSPAGGQGMNTGLQDAVNLAWKIAFVCKRGASSKLLDTYDLERRKVGKTLLRATAAASYMASAKSPFLLFLREKILRLLTKSSFVRRYIALSLSELGICYPRNLITKDPYFGFKGPKAGFRAPDGLVICKKKSSSLYELWQNSGSFHLLIFLRSGNQDLQKKIEDLSFAWLSITVVVNGSMSYIEEEGMQVCIDPIGKLHKDYGVSGKGGVYIIRPDLYIGYRSVKLEEKKIRNYFKKMGIYG
jgi:2-polyprenyl-6-methoxyphenol hydroxylase-like FAD-dependent oxidoreductase